MGICKQYVTILKQIYTSTIYKGRWINLFGILLFFECGLPSHHYKFQNENALIPISFFNIEKLVKRYSSIPNNVV